MLIVNCLKMRSKKQSNLLFISDPQTFFTGGPLLLVSIQKPINTVPTNFERKNGAKNIFYCVVQVGFVLINIPSSGRFRVR